MFPYSLNLYGCIQGRPARLPLLHHCLFMISKNVSLLGLYILLNGIISSLYIYYDGVFR